MAGTIVLLWLLLGCRSVDPVVKVGLVAPFEGQQRAVGYDVIYSARLAVREINATGGIGGYRVALVALDDRGDVELARETAVSLTLDPGVVAVIGHWSPAATEAAVPIYAAADLPHLPAGAEPIETYPPAQLPADFRTAYADVTPFDETAGPYAGPAYDAFQLLWQAMRDATAAGGDLNRDTLAAALEDLQVPGMTGTIYVRD